MRIRIILLALLQLCPAIVCAAEKPNILFFFVDDQRHNTLGCAGHAIVKTPNVDRLAKQGVRFDHAYVTTPICWVSRASLLTGMWSRTQGTKARVDAVNATAASTIYPKLLKQAGYRNGFFGKWHARMPRGFNQAQYFARYKGISRNPYFKKQADGSLRHETELIGDHAVSFLKSQPKDKPFCLNLWFNASHAEDGDKRPGVGHFPWPKAVDGMYENTKIPPPRLSAKRIYESQPPFLKKSLNRVRYFWRWDTPKKYTTNMRAYFRMLSGIDGVIARVTKVLKQQGLAENTIIIYSADNGYYMGDRGFAGKWSHYDESVRVPLIIYDPRLPENLRGRVVSKPVLNVDLAPTFLELAGVKKPGRYQGKSLLPLVKNKTVKDWRKDVFLEHLLEFGTRLPKWEGVRGERYVYARYIEHNYEFLHDLKKDPDQLQNFAKNPKYKSVLEQMRKRNRKLRDERGGEYVPKGKRVKRKRKKSRN